MFGVANNLLPAMAVPVHFGTQCERGRQQVSAGPMQPGRMAWLPGVRDARPRERTLLHCVRLRYASSGSLTPQMERE